MKSMKQLCLIGAATLGLLALLPGDAFAQRAPIGGGGAARVNRRQIFR